MAETNSIQLDRLYYGNLLVGDKRASVTAGVIARTPAVTPEQATACVQFARLRPPTPDEATSDMPGALGLFRGGSQAADYILVKAQHNVQGLPQVLFIMVPLAVQRQLGGNVLAFRALGMAAMPSFSEVKSDIQPFELHDPAPPTAEEQTDALMDLLLYCEDQFAIVEGILAGIVQGWPVAIVNSPPVLQKRLQFLQGLMSLLPTPARAGITFATHVNDFAAVNAQIKFASASTSPPKHVVYDWGKGKLLTSAPEDAYSRYILAQLRLDPSLVVAETDRLARTAVWRAMHRENLGKALKWVSRRAALDQIVRDGQPADRDSVAAVLREDPTLPDDLRHFYIRHLLAFALALEEPASADVVAAQCATYPDLTLGVVEQLTTAIEGEQARLVFTMLERWMLRVPEGSPEQWQPLLQSAAKTHLKTMIRAGQTEQALKFISYLRQAPPVLRMQDAMGEVIEIASAAARTNGKLARHIFVLAAEHVPAGALQRLFDDAAFVRHLPEPLRAVASYLQAEARPAPSPQLLHKGALAFGDGYRMLVLSRLVELAVMQRRAELIDLHGLQALLVMTQSPRSDQFRVLVQHIIDDLSTAEALSELPAPGPRILLQLLLQTHDFEHAAAMLGYYQNTLYGADRMDEFIAVVGELFRQVALSTEDLITALEHLENSPVHPGPRAMIYVSVLDNRQWSAEMEYVAKQLTTLIFNDENLIGIVGRDNAIRLLEFHAKPQNALDTLRVAAALIEHMIQMGVEGAALLTRIWPLMTWNDEVTSTALELLRRYLRGIPQRKAPAVVSYLSEELGAEIGGILYATYIMRFIVPDADLLAFAENLHLAAELFIDIATTYHSNKELPTVLRLRRDLDTMTGGLNDQERQQVADNLLTIPVQIRDLGTERARPNARADHRGPLVAGHRGPQDGLELLWFVGGHFGQHKNMLLNLEREEMAHLFGTRSAAMFLRETNAITELLQGLQWVSEQLRTRAVDAQALRAELNSLWDTISLYNKRRIQDQLARNSQQLTDVIEVMAQHASERVLGDSGIARQLEQGKRQPQSAVETMRWIHGYFARKHSRA